MNIALDTINEYCACLKLTGVLRSFQSLADECAMNQTSYVEFLSKVLGREIEQREQRNQESLLQLARFPNVKKLDDFDFGASNVNKPQITELSTLHFLDRKENIVFIGSSGTGKTHLASALGYLATQRRIKAKFINAADLIVQLEAASLSNMLSKYMNKVISKSGLLIIDEFGYVKFNAAQANLFFQVINKRYETGSIIITSNLTFTKWKEILNNDEALTTAILDRLLHHSHIITIQGDSYRLKQKTSAGIMNLNRI